MGVFDVKAEYFILHFFSSEQNCYIVPLIYKPNFRKLFYLCASQGSFRADVSGPLKGLDMSKLNGSVVEIGLMEHFIYHDDQFVYFTSLDHNLTLCRVPIGGGSYQWSNLSSLQDYSYGGVEGVCLTTSCLASILTHPLPRRVYLSSQIIDQEGKSYICGSKQT